MEEKPSPAACSSQLGPGAREMAEDGSYRRQQSAFRDVVGDGRVGLPAEPGRYHLYVSWACPWSHRALIVHRLKGLEKAIGISVADPIRDERGWAFTGDGYVDSAEGFEFLSQAYHLSDPSFDGRFSVPVLWDRRERRIVSNDSADIVKMLARAWDAWAEKEADLYPEPLRAEVDATIARNHEAINDAVYRTGFAGNQRIYEQEVVALFAALREVDARLSRSRFLVGERVTIADWCLFPTLVRFDAVYNPHFKCSLARLTDLPGLYRYAQRLYRLPGVSATVRLDEIKRHYYVTQRTINPTGIVPLGPDVLTPLAA